MIVYKKFNGVSKMAKKSKLAYVTPIGGNVFADLGFSAKSAIFLRATARRKILKKIQIQSRDKKNLLPKAN